MPAKDAAPYIAECLDSIINQSHEKWELIVINDHSSDSTAEILETYSSKERRMTWHHAKGQGIIDALQQATHFVSGQYITRMDADDIMSPTKLEDMLAVLTTRGNGHIAVGLVNYFSETELGNGYTKYANWLNKLTTAESNYSQIYKECVIPSPCWMVSKVDFELAGAFDKDVYPEDYDLCFRFRNAGLKIAAVPKVLHYWRDHPSRASRNDPNYKDNSFIELKIKHFVESDWKSDCTLIVWGAGKKGKRIVQLLLAYGKSVKWFCDNPNKIGQNVYGVIIENQKSIESISSAQVIVAIANPDEQKQIKDYLLAHPRLDSFFFC
jgi:glycosyltransferase involved in cell wall biosynthesis